MSDALPTPVVVPGAGLVFPVLLWYPEYIYFAKDLLTLCVHPRGMFPASRRIAQEGVTRLADSSGRVFEVRDFRTIRPFGGLKCLPYLLLLSVFAEPVCELKAQQELVEFRRTIGRAVASRYRTRFTELLNSAQSPAAVLAVAANV